MTDTPKSTHSDGVDHADHHSNYRLKVTAGPGYDPKNHKLVPVNSPQTLTFESEHMVISTAVRIRKFTGFPENSPETSSYFDNPLHTSDQYSISFSFIPKVDIPGNDLVFGNDFDRPIRDRLPPGFNQALRIVKWWIDPGLEGDAYADKPYLYGPALSSWNILRIGDKTIDKENLEKEKAHGWKIPNAETFHGTVVEEGADGSGEDIRHEQSIPADALGRKKFFLTESHRHNFIFEAGRLYQSDFGNPYLDFNDFSLKLPGFSLNVIKYVDSKSHELRYTLKNKSTDDVYMVVMFTLLFGDELQAEEGGSVEAAPVDQNKATEKTETSGEKPGRSEIGDDDDDVD